jgi:UDP-GlcNAc:undecaprenyl-phosphate GlcNAc-1-phosphate transferase
MRFQGLSRAVFVLHWLLFAVLVCASRVSFRVLGEVLRGPRPGARAVLVYGAGDGGELVVRELRNNSALARETVGFIDDDRAKAGTRIHGVPVLGALEEIETLLRAHRVDQVVVASRKIPPERLRRLQIACAAQGVAVVRASVRLE